MNKRLSIKLSAVAVALCLLLSSLFFGGFSAAESAEHVLFEGNATSVFTSWSDWKAAVSIDNDRTNFDKFTKPFTVEVHYEAKDVPILIMQSWSGGTSWAHMIPSYVSKGVAYYRYDTISTHYGTDFSLLNSVKVMPNGSDLTVTKVSFRYQTEEITVPYVGLAGQIVNDINAGWNLGNTLDSHADWILDMTGGNPTDFETAWENPVTTQKIIDDINSAGFNAIRLPVTWKQHMDSTGRVDTAWMDRVQEVVDYIVDSGMYCILNVHHDTGEAGWLKATSQCVEENGDKFTYLWTQIAERFRDYDEKLLFEGFNEILDDTNDWEYASKDATDSVNKFNQMFVDAVRSTGGRNSIRCLVVNTYAANTNGGNLDEFLLPSDTAENSLIVEVHYYHPYKYCTETYPDSRTWTDEDGKLNMNGTLYSLYRHFTGKGIPVIIGEFGVSYKNNESDRCDYGEYLTTEAKGYGIKCFYWDPGGSFKVYENYGHYAGMGLYNRFTNTWVYPDFVKSITGIDPLNPPTEPATVPTIPSETTAPTVPTEPAPTATEPPAAVTEPATTSTEPTEATTAPFIPTTAESTPTDPSASDTTSPSTGVAPEGLIGDADLSGKVNVKDATQVQKAVADLITLTEEQTSNADADRSGNINIKDATAIQKFVAGIIPEL